MGRCSCNCEDPFAIEPCPKHAKPAYCGGGGGSGGGGGLEKNDAANTAGGRKRKAKAVWQPP